ncbi:ribose-phosphate diphosphokinase [Altererythrobacter litoralis]|uniref:Ribose-phosphate diphosphokinase n=1 Tax=Altererythrobacter litoralis TaxID=3113904 RepID=A0ABU7GCJ7_9SPHN|nr:ribose-phosphate diphosphokinase [Erythrobacteraceae bacterium 1XM1-14]
MAGAVFAFAEEYAPAARLAGALGCDISSISLHRFPDGESLVQVARAPSIALLYRSLDDPNAKLVEILLAASALRDNGAARVVLVAPYLAYMRQDMAFEPGQAVSQRVIGALLAQHFDGVLTVDPHLHRIASLDEVMSGTDAVSLSAAPVLSQAIDRADNPVLVGPDAESRQWVEAIAQPMGLDVLLGEKQRHGDRDVSIAFEGLGAVTGRRAILVDDVISSGRTLQCAARLLREAGAAGVDAIVTHCLSNNAELAELAASGIDRIRSTDSVQGPTATIPLAGLLAGAILDQGWLENE